MIHKIEKIKNLNEIIFTYYMFSMVAFWPVGIWGGEIPYRIFFILNTLVLFVFSLIKNKKVLIKKDIILLIIVSGIGIIDIFFRKNNYTIMTYIKFFQDCYIPCYLFNRTNNIKNIIKYMAIFSKIIIIAYIFDPFFGYYFSGTYMAYGYSIMLASVFSIYIYYLIRKNNTDIIFLILGFIAIFIYGNRACVLSMFFMFILTYKLLIKRLGIGIRKIGKKRSEFLKKTSIIFGIFIISFVVNYALIIQIPRLLENGNLSTICFESYSVRRYKETIEGIGGDITSGRLAIYSKAVGIIKDTYTRGIETLLFGNGTGYFRNINEGIYTHSIIFDLLIEYGIFGTILFIGLLLYCVFIWLKNSKTYKFLFGAYLIGLVFPKLLLSSYFQTEGCLFLFIIFVTSNYAIKSKDKKKIIK